MKVKFSYSILLLLTIIGSVYCQENPNELYQLAIKSVEKKNGEYKINYNKRKKFYIYKDILNSKIEDQKWSIFEFFPEDSLFFKGDFEFSKEIEVNFNEEFRKAHNIIIINEFKDTQTEDERFKEDLLSTVHFSKILYINDFAYLRAQTNGLMNDGFFWDFLFVIDKNRNWEVKKMIFHFTK